MAPATASDAIADWLAACPRLILDGALATELERRGADLNDALWSARLLVEQPELIRAVHLDYFRAGAVLAGGQSRARPRLQVLASAGADVLACETLPCLAEARALARLLNELPDSGTTRAWITLLLPRRPARQPR